MSTISELMAQLKQGCEVIPISSYQHWDVERVRAFKAAVIAGKKLLARQRAPSANELSAAINRIASFW